MKKLDSVLFLGIGGGNDVFSTLYAASCLRHIDWHWNRAAIAGVISPFHHHTLTAHPDTPGLFSTTAESKRFLLRHNDKREIPFVDATVSRYLTSDRAPGEKLFRIENQFAISLEGGSIGVSLVLKELARRYEYIVLVDVGGDVFYAGPEDKHVMSPFFDATVLKGFVDSNVPGVLVEIGPGTDGEIDPEALEERLKPHESHPIWQKFKNVWPELFGIVRGVRTGRTLPALFKAFACREEVLELEYTARAHIGDERRYITFTQRIFPRLCERFYLIEPKLIKNPLAVRSRNPYHWFAETHLEKVHCEINLEYFRIGGKLVQFAVPSPLFEERVRLELIELCLAGLGSACDRAIVEPKDWAKLPRTTKERFETGIVDKRFLEISP